MQLIFEAVRRQVYWTAQCCQQPLTTASQPEPAAVPKSIHLTLQTVKRENTPHTAVGYSHGTDHEPSTTARIPSYV
jgi:hypothetical protein